MPKPSAGDTVIPTKTSSTIIIDETSDGGVQRRPARTESNPVARKRQLEPLSTKTEVPRKNPRHGESSQDPARSNDRLAGRSSKTGNASPMRIRGGGDPMTLKRPPEDLPCDVKMNNAGPAEDGTCESAFALAERIKHCSTSSEENAQAPGRILDEERKELDVTRLVRKSNARTEDRRLRSDKVTRKDDSVRSRRTVQWLEEGARRTREDLAVTRAELDEERRAARLAKREFDAAVREARSVEIVKHRAIISELKARLSQSPVSAVESSLASAKADHLKDENHRRELSAVKKRLVEAEATIRKLRSNSLEPRNTGKRRKVNDADSRKIETEIQNLRATNRKLEEKLHMAVDAERCRTAELRIQHEIHEAELASLQRTLRSDTIKMMDEIRGKGREIEKLEKLLAKGSQMHRKLRSKEDNLMRKLRESERNHQIRLAPRAVGNVTNGDHAVVDLCKGECDAVAEIERLRELVVEQREVIQVLGQAVKERERKLDQLTNKRRKEEFYKQWLELEPVAEVDDEEEHDEEGDSALSSGPSSLSPQPGGYGQWQAIAVTREAYEAALSEVKELQMKLIEEQRELTHAKSQVRDLERALLQETRGSQNGRRALGDKLRQAEEREASLLAEISELREQNELLEFRVLELEETPSCPRDTPDPADSGIVSPEPIHLYKDRPNKHRDRAVATVIPYNTYIYPVSPIPHKPPLSLQESGIFEEEEEDAEVELASRGTQTEAPAGELLQEVQRLHELRARIQERAAVKVPVPVVDAKTCSSLEVGDAADVAQLTTCQERIRDLEERLGSYREAEERRLRDEQSSKQREEELLDENYKLTERIHWFENELRSFEGDVVESATLPVAEENGTSSPCARDRGPPEEEEEEEEEEAMENSTSRCQTVLGDNCAESNDQVCRRLETNGIMIQSSCTKGQKCAERRNLWADCNDELQHPSRAERCARGQIVDLERRERALVKTLRQADSTWLRVESDYASQLEDSRGRLNEKVDVDRKLIDRLASMEEDVRRNSLRETSENPRRCANEADRTENAECSVDDNIQTTTDLITEVDQDTGRCSLVSNRNQCNVPRSVQTVVSYVNEFIRPKELTSRRDVVSNSHDRIAVDVPRGLAAEEVPEVAAEATEETLEDVGGAVSQVRIVPEEERAAETEAVVTFTESEPEKKDRNG